MIENRPLRVFLCHSSKDNAAARELYSLLNAEAWMDIWFVEDRLLPSQEWGGEITKAVANADVVVILVSKSFSIDEKTPYPCWSFVTDSLSEKVYIITLRVDEADVPVQLKTWQSLNYFPRKQRKPIYQKLVTGLKARAEQLNISLNKPTPDPAPEKSMQWTPSLWKQLDAEDSEFEAGKEPRDSRWIRTRQRLGKKIFRGVSNVFVWTAAVCTLLVVSICGLMINALVRGENTNSFTAPIVSRALTLVPLPTPTLGVGSIRISPKDGMRMVYVPDGEFRMGSNEHQDDEKPIHKVFLDAYWIDQYEVTNGMYAKCIEAKICSVPMPDGFFLSSFDSVTVPDQLLSEFFAERSDFFQRLATEPEFFNQPALGIHWGNANAYCRWVDRRLPTEAEWEKAARGVDRRTYPWGETIDCTKANFSSCVDSPSRVGSFEEGQSPYGAYDMAGNAMEWVADWYSSLYYQNSTYENPLGPATGLYRVYRGGSWGSDDFVNRSANRPGYIITIPNDLIGFRCASSE